MPTEKVITSMTNSQREERDGMRETNGGEHRAEAGGEELTETIDSLSQKGPHQGGNQATGDGSHQHNCESLAHQLTEPSQRPDEVL